VNKDKFGLRILFFDHLGQRHTLRLKKVPVSVAKQIADKIEQIVNCKKYGINPPPELIDWLNKVDVEFYERLAGFGIVEGKRKLTVGEFVDRLLEKKRNEIGRSNFFNWKKVCELLKQKHANLPLSEFTIQHAQQIYEALKQQNLRTTSIAKKISICRSIFREAIHQKLITENPFQLIKVKAILSDERKKYVSIEDIEHVIDVVPNAYWKLLIALARFAGLRTPSESLMLKWSDIDWEGKKIRITSPKTAHQNRTQRMIPLFPSLVPYLEMVKQVNGHSEFVFPDHWVKKKDSPGFKSNLRLRFTRYVKKAGLTPWPKIWHNLRASFESDLVKHFPLATVTKWLGNSIQIAMKHYVDVTETDYEKALTIDLGRNGGNSVPRNQGGNEGTGT